MPNAFPFSASPFDCLNKQEQRLVADSVDIAYFKQGEIILDIGSTPTHLFVIIKGFVRQYENDEELAVYGPWRIGQDRRAQYTYYERTFLYMVSAFTSGGINSSRYLSRGLNIRLVNTLYDIVNKMIHEPYPL